MKKALEPRVGAKDPEVPASDFGPWVVHSAQQRMDRPLGRLGTREAGLLGVFQTVDMGLQFIERGPALEVELQHFPGSFRGLLAGP
jgi:hypothetical protein